MWLFAWFCHFYTSRSGCCLRDVRSIIWGVFSLPLPWISISLSFSIWIVFLLSYFSRISFCRPHISPPLCGGMILLYPLVGRGENSRSIRLGSFRFRQPSCWWNENQNQVLYVTYGQGFWTWICSQCHQILQHLFGHVAQSLWWACCWFAWWTSIGFTAAWALYHIFGWKWIPQWTWKFGRHWAAHLWWRGLWFCCPWPWGICHLVTSPLTGGYSLVPPWRFRWHPRKGHCTWHTLSVFF